MSATPATHPRRGIGRVIAALIAFSLVAPPGMVALPLAGLTLVSRPRGDRGLWLGIPAAALAIWWLSGTGEFPGQVVRGAAVIATAAFVVLTVLTNWSVVHRGLISAAIAAGGVATGFLAFGWSWDRLHWWVAYRTAATLRWQLGLMWRGAREDVVLAPSGAFLRQMESAYDTLVTGIANLFPATVALQLLAGFALAVALHYRVARQPVGRPLGRLAQFRFSEHLGWGVALPLAALLLVPVDAVRVVAANLLVISATLYVLRGTAVAAFALRRLGAGPLLYAGLVVALFFTLPVALGAAMVLGVLDARLDLRARWSAPPTGP